MIPDADQLQVVQATDPITGGNYNGTEHELLTFTLVATWDLGTDGRGGSLSSYTGYTDSDSEQDFEGNWDAMTPGDDGSLDGTYSYTLPPCGRTSCSPSQQQIAWTNEIDLFSQEIRYASNFDGPVQFTLGGLYWHEDAGQVSRGNSTIAPSNNRGGFAPFGAIENLPPAWTVLPTVFFPEFPFVGRDTEHWSAYGLVEWDIASAWTLSVEGRYVDEELTVEGPVCDAAATEALTGIPSGTDPATGDDVCNGTFFRGPSSTTQTRAAGSPLPTGTYTTAVTFTGSGVSSDSFFTPKVTLEWTPTDTQMWYFTWAEGKKPGGITTISAGTFFDVQGRTFEQETLTNWEIGGKTGWLNGSLVVNGAAFFQDYEDKQVGVTQFSQITQADFGAIENAGEAEIWGIELSAQWQPGERWLLSAGYTWLDAEYTFFESITGSANEVARAQAAGNGGCLEIVPSATPNTDDIRDRCVVNRTGNKIEDIPENSFVGGVHYTAPIGGSGLDWFAEANAIFTDERWVEENNVQLLDSYWLFDFRLGLRADSWDVLFYVDNLTDDDTSKSALDVGSQTNTMRQGQWPPGPTDGVIVNLPDPRIYGVRATFRF
jgi:outer membrane receptor protein involved in Fe transport